jgi:hypothetical protein
MSPEQYEGWFPTFRAMPRDLLSLLLHILLRILRGIAWLWRKTWRFSLTALILLVVAHTIFNFIAGRRLEAELNRIRQAGEPLTLAEAAPPQIPDVENAAVLYQKVFRQLRHDEKSGHGDSLDPDLQTIKRFVAWRPYQKEPRPTLAEATEAVAKRQSVFQLLEQASLRPACRFPVNWKAGLEARFPHLAQIRLAIRLLTAKALVDSAAGNSEKTVTDIATIIRMTNHIAPEPTLISQLVRIAYIAIIFQQFPAILEAAPPDLTQSRALYDLLATAEDRAPYVHAMEGERCFGLTVFDIIRRKKADEIFSSVLPSDEGHPGARIFRRLWPAIRPIWSPFLKLDEIYYLKFMQREINISAQPYREVYKRYQTMPERGPWYAIGSAITLPVFSGGHQSLDRLIAEVAAMRGALALRAYQIEHGQYPDSLAQLRAAGGWEIPEDPFTGKELIYRRQGQGYILYSVGPNFKDDGGLNSQEVLEQRKKAYPNYDIAIKMTR